MLSHARRWNKHLALAKKTFYRLRLTTAFKNCGLTGYFQQKFTNQHNQVGLTERRPFAAFCYALSAANFPCVFEKFSFLWCDRYRAHEFQIPQLLKAGDVVRHAQLKFKTTMGFFDFIKPDKNINSQKPSYMKPLTEYFASVQEIKEVSDAIAKHGFWEENIEWKISTATISRIERKIENGKEWFITTVECEQKIRIPAASIERAIVFKKIYFDFQLELLYSVGWASWKTKETP